MSKMIKRIASGLIALSIAVSAVGIDAVIDDLRLSQIVTAEGSPVSAQKKGSSTGFDDLQKDTKGTGAEKLYNTSYGLHTDKTVSAAYDDGRTFDLDLESWYIGEKPADVGLVLDASGSMAWTVDPLEPLQFDDKTVQYLNEHSMIDENGFLTTDGENYLLHKEYTDNSLLNYKDYKYYVYDEKSATAEFVPLGYWGGQLIETESELEKLKAKWQDYDLIGYYPFETGHNLKNMISGDNALVLENPSDNVYSKSNLATSQSADMTSGGKYREDNTDDRALKVIDSTKDNGGILLDVSPSADSDDDLDFTISFAVYGKNLINTQPEIDILQILNLGVDYTKSTYYKICTPAAGSRNHLRFFQATTKKSGFNNFFSDTNYREKSTVVTYVVENNIVTMYVNGEPITDENSTEYDRTLTPLDRENLAIIIGAGNYGKTLSGSLNIDELYVFNSALGQDKVKELYGDMKTQSTSSERSALNDRAVDNDGKVIAHIKPDSNLASVANREGWYYVNSHSDWDVVNNEEIGTGKEFEQLIEETEINEYIATADEEKNEDKKTEIIKKGNEYLNRIATHITRPGAYKSTDYDKDYVDNTDTKIINAFKSLLTTSGTSTSCKFFIDEQYHLRCYFNTSSATSTSNADKESYNTQCSLVYQKDDDQLIKTQVLNNALNEFLKNLKGKSSASKVSAVRFSLEKLLDKTSATEDSEENLDKLTLLDWTDEITDNMNIIDPRYPDSANANSAIGNTDGEFNYFLTGGTYTWTGLKAFYDNLHKDSDVSKDGRSKYLIIFTDGRDNLIGNTKDKKYVTDFNSKDKTYGDFSPEGDEYKATYDSDLAGKWADKIKDEGYTIYSVILATGQISPTSNTEEFESAEGFLKTLVGNKDTKVEDKESYIFVADPTEGEDALQKQFQFILERMNSSLTEYTVQDYIDPRFDLVDYTTDKENGTVLHLGAGGKITDSNGKEHKVGNIIADSDAIGCDYTPKALSVGGGEKNQATIYYDDDKDMYYLRWKVDSIGGGTKPFTTGVDTDIDKYLDESTADKAGRWFSTITVKAKDDFIGGNAILTNGNEAGMNLVFSSASLNGLSGEAVRNTLQTLSGTDKSQDRDKDGNEIDGVVPSKGFPRTTVNVRLLDIKTKPLNDVIYLGEVVSPTYMLSELENGYMEGSYYLEYLERYAYRLYGDKKDVAPLLELLNDWLGINNADQSEKTFTIPYIYLPDPEYKDNKLVEVDGKAQINNSSGKDSTDTDFSDPNLRDVVGFLTYTWMRADPEDTSKKYDNSKLPTGKTIIDEFVVLDTESIVYNLQLKFTPLKEEDLSSYDLDTDYFIKDDKFFTVKDGKFVTSTDNKWTLNNRTNYLDALVTDTQVKKDTPTESENVYEWDSVYKPTMGNEQVEPDRKYGDAEVSDDKLSLDASTTYTKDVVNAGLALELIVKGQDIDTFKGTGTDKTFTFTAVRDYKDINDPLPYGDHNELGATTKEGGQKYTLNFKIKSTDIPSTPDVNTDYTIWATLDSVVLLDDDGTTQVSPYPYPEKSLPIGTYTITANLNDQQFMVNNLGSTTRFIKLTADNNSGSFSHTRFPDAVTSVSDSAVETTGDPQYLIDNTTDQSSYNIAENKREVDSGTAGKNEQSLTFYFGTVAEKEIGGKTLHNTKGESRNKNPDADYAKDRLGIMLLSYTQNSLVISKTVENSKDPKVLDNKWNFDVKLTTKEKISTTVNLKWTEMGTGVELATGGNTGREASITLDEKSDSTSTSETIYTYTGTISLKAGEQVELLQLPDATFEVSEVRASQNNTDGVDFTQDYMYEIGGRFSSADKSGEITCFQGASGTEHYASGKGSGTLGIKSGVNFVNTFPVVQLPSTGGTGTHRYIVIGGALTSAAAAILVYLTLRRRKSRAVG